jgi:hypothetical protein
MLFRAPVFLVLTVLTAASPETRRLIEQALDEPTKISLDNIKLGDAIGALTQQTGVRIVMSPEAMRFVAQGANTLVRKAEIANVPLRVGLTRLFEPLGMTWRVAESVVEVIPKDAIACLGRPPTKVELDLLSELSAMQPGLDERALDRLRPRIQFQVPDLGDTWGSLKAAVRAVGAGPGDEVLTTASEKLGWAWCLSGERITIAPAGAQYRARLQQPVSLRINNRPLYEVLNTVGAQVQVPIRVEPGVLAALPPGTQRSMILNVQQQPVEQILDGIAANTGLAYLIGPEGVVFYRPSVGGGRTADAPPSPGSADPYVAKIIVPLGDGRTFEWLIRRSELPEDLREMRDDAIQETIDALRRQAATAGGH